MSMVCDLTPDQARHFTECVRQWARFCFGIDDIDMASDLVVLDASNACEKNSRLRLAFDRWCKSHVESDLGSREDWVRDVGYDWPMELAVD